MPTATSASGIAHVLGLDWKAEAGPASNPLAADSSMPLRRTLATDRSDDLQWSGQPYRTSDFPSSLPERTLAVSVHLWLQFLPTSHSRI